MTLIAPDTLVLIDDEKEGRVRRFVPAGEQPVPDGTMVRGWAGRQDHDRYLIQVEPALELERHGPDRLHVVRAEKVRTIDVAESVARLFLRLVKYLPKEEVTAALGQALALHRGELAKERTP